MHVPVLLKECLSYIPASSKLIVDATFGNGGYSRLLLSQFPTATIIAIDRDEDAFNRALLMQKEHSRLIPILGPFGQLRSLLGKAGVEDGSVDAVLFDIGLSTNQLNDSKRGFSFMSSGPLDMRMSGDRGYLTAETIVNNYSMERIADILMTFGEEKQAKKIARAIDNHRRIKWISTTDQLAKIIEETIGSFGRIHAATKSFQALRIYVNDELGELRRGLLDAEHMVRKDGVCIVVTFHSLEDRLAKKLFLGQNGQLLDLVKADRAKYSRMRKASLQAEKLYLEDDSENDGLIQLPVQRQDLKLRRFEMITKRVVIAGDEEVRANPRSRSAKLRAMRRTGLPPSPISDEE